MQKIILDQTKLFRLLEVTHKYGELRVRFVLLTLIIFDKERNNFKTDKISYSRL